LGTKKGLGIKKVGNDYSRVGFACLGSCDTNHYKLKKQADTYTIQEQKKNTYDIEMLHPGLHFAVFVLDGISGVDAPLNFHFEDSAQNEVGSL